MRLTLLAVVAFCLLSLPTQAQSLYDELNDALLVAEKTDRAIERGKIAVEQVLYEAFEDDPYYGFTGHTTVSLWQTHEGFIRMTTLHEWPNQEPEAKSLYLDASFHPLVLIDESNHDFKKCVVFEGDEPAIYAEANWFGDHYGDYTIYRITPKEYRYASQMLAQYEQVLEDWVRKVQSKHNRRRVGEYAVARNNPLPQPLRVESPAQNVAQNQPQPMQQNPEQHVAQNQPQPTQQNPEQQLKQAAGALLIQSLSQALQKWIK